MLVPNMDSSLSSLKVKQGWVRGLYTYYISCKGADFTRIYPYLEKLNRKYDYDLNIFQSEKDGVSVVCCKTISGRDYDGQFQKDMEEVFVRYFTNNTPQKEACYVIDCFETALFRYKYTIGSSNSSLASLTNQDIANALYNYGERQFSIKSIEIDDYGIYVVAEKIKDMLPFDKYRNVENENKKVVWKDARTKDRTQLASNIKQEVDHMLQAKSSEAIDRWYTSIVKKLSDLKDILQKEKDSYSQTNEYEMG